MVPRTCPACLAKLTLSGRGETPAAGEQYLQRRRNMWISPNFQRSDFKRDLNIDDMIAIFEDRTLGWQLRIAQETCAKIPHAGFAVLHIVMSYFEMITQFERGEISEGRSPEFFKHGLKSVLPELANNQYLDDISRILYRQARCGLYHSGITKANITISNSAAEALAWVKDFGRLIVNPESLVKAMIVHFEGFVRRLKDSKEAELRANFKKRFELEKPKIDMSVLPPDSYLAVEAFGSSSFD
ncbi:MAG: hypothetical protein V1784_03020 [bacterium]